MTETSETPEAGIAQAVTNLSDQTRALVKDEIDSALREIWEKAKRSGPPVTLLAVSGVLTLSAAASSYRLILRLLEKRLSPAEAAFAAAVGYGMAAVCTGVLGIRQLRDAPAPLPTQTVREASGAMTDAAEKAGRDSVSGASGPQGGAASGEVAQPGGGEPDH
jgi:hypothetical protein